ncbi:hypothetical protein DPMN_068749 [Dreissena polymorpha]|uniref:Uncharacterized protein n=1 Tax=Dreissena polymorpha TaxID=45954 RepID=A0A9D3Z2T7_DREPO|nr:hypothetical protein DPMN_068749 [Dreissena polymorpha]
MILKATCVSQDLSKENQIDHLCIVRKFRRFLQDVRQAFSKEQTLVVAQIKLKLKKS